jgi:hypothetical protein
MTERAIVGRWKKGRCKLPLNTNIVMLGASGSGKTIYLTSLFMKLCIEGRDSVQPFRLKTEVEMFDRLNNIWGQVEDPTGGFPFANLDIVRALRFRCCTTETHRLYEVCHFTYIDYGGGLLTEVDKDPQQKDQLQSSIQQADVLLGLLDGVEVLKLMEGKSSPRWRRDFRVMLQYMQNSSANIHFVISKWDCIEKLGKGANFRDVRNKLFEDEDFKKLIELKSSPGQHTKVRLIPVKSLGDEFVRCIPEQQGITMKKNQNGTRIMPKLVEVPLAYALVDTLSATQRELQMKYESMVWWHRLRSVPNFLMNLGIEIGTELSPLGPAHKILTRQGLEILLQRTDPDHDPRGLKRLRNEKAALEKVLLCFKRIIKSFEQKFPESVLNEEEWPL